jgi:hypothetical protein
MKTWLILLVCSLSGVCAAQQKQQPLTITVDQLEAGDPIELCKGLHNYTKDELTARDEKECLAQRHPACERIHPSASYAIFTGRVVKVTRSDAHFLQNGHCLRTSEQTATVEVMENFIGHPSGTVTIHAGNLNGFYFVNDKSGDEYLFFAKPLKDGSLTVTECGGTKLLRDAKDDIAFLEAWPTLPKTGTIYGDAWLRINKDDPARMSAWIGRAIVHAPITVLGPRNTVAVTDKSGHFSISGLPPGHYDLMMDVPYDRLGIVRGVDVVERGCAVASFHADPAIPRDLESWREW